MINYRVNTLKLESVLYQIALRHQRKDCTKPSEVLSRGIFQKIGYCIDFGYYARYKKKLTGEIYVHSDNGPVPMGIFGDIGKIILGIQGLYINSVGLYQRLQGIAVHAAPFPQDIPGRVLPAGDAAVNDPLLLRKGQPPYMTVGSQPGQVWGIILQKFHAAASFLSLFGGC